MSTLKSYSEARKELERIAAKRKQYFSGSKLVDEKDLIQNTSKVPSSHPIPTTTTASASYPFSSPLPSSGLGKMPLFGSKSPGSTLISPTSPLQPSPSLLRDRPHPDLRTMMSMTPPTVSHSSFPSSTLHTTNTNNIVNSSTYFHEDLSHDPTSPATSFLPGPASTVIAAFRQLQIKARQIEQERAEIIRDRDELKRQLEANHRTQSFWRNQSEQQTNDSYQTIRAATEQIAITKREIDKQCTTAQEVNLSAQRSNASDRAQVKTMEHEVADLHAKLHVLQTMNRSLEHELQVSHIVIRSMHIVIRDFLFASLSCTLSGMHLVACCSLSVSCTLSIIIIII